MNTFDILHPGPWFGPKPDSSGAVMRSDLADEEIRFLEICFRLKSGDFTARPLLEVFIIACSDVAVKRQAIRLYCYVARHEDISFLGKLLERCDHEEVFSVVIYAPHTLSPQVVPYLFALLEEYKDTVIEADILSSINMIFPFQYDGSGVDIVELGARFSGFAKSLILQNYYYEGIEAFAGDLTKKLIEAAANARHQKTAFPLTDAPTLLSVWSGEKCPVFYGESVTDIVFEKTMEYAKCIASMSWVKGGKYFYGYRIDS